MKPATSHRKIHRQPGHLQFFNACIKHHRQGCRSTDVITGEFVEIGLPLGQGKTVQLAGNTELAGAGQLCLIVVNGQQAPRQHAILLLQMGAEPTISDNANIQFVFQRDIHLNIFYRCLSFTGRGRQIDRDALQPTVDLQPDGTSVVLNGQPDFRLNWRLPL